MDRVVDLAWGQRTVVDVAGIGIHTEVAGPARPSAAHPAVTIAALHGFASGTFTWAGVAGAWQRTHRLVAWDRPPFGRSDRPRPPRPGAPDPYGLPAAVDHASAVLDLHATGGPLVVVGHSAGAVVATELARREPGRFAGVVLVSPALDSEPPALARRLLSLPGASTVGAAGLRVAVHGTRLALRGVGQHGTPMLAATGAETARTLRRPGTATALVHLTRTWARPDLLDDLGPLGVPTLVVAGADDRIASVESSRRLATRLHAELEVLADVGHAPQEQVPEVVSELVANFVADVT